MPFTVKELDEMGRVTFTWNFRADPPKLPSVGGESSDYATMMTDLPEVGTDVSEMGSGLPNTELGFPERCKRTM